MITRERSVTSLAFNCKDLSVAAAEMADSLKEEHPPDSQSLHYSYMFICLVQVFHTPVLTVGHTHCSSKTNK